MYTINANEKASKTITVSDKNLETIRKYELLERLLDSNGIVDEDTLGKLKLNVRSLIDSEPEDQKDLLDLCFDVIYHSNMKAYGLVQLITLYDEWLRKNEQEAFLREETREE